MALQAALYGETGNQADSVKITEELIASGYTDVNFITRIFSLLYKHDKKQEATRVLELSLDKTKEPTVIELYVKALTDQGQAEGALQVLDDNKLHLDQRVSAIIRAFILRESDRVDDRAGTGFRCRDRVRQRLCAGASGSAG
jgi:hypothetical protein